MSHVCANSPFQSFKGRFLWNAVALEHRTWKKSETSQLRCGLLVSAPGGDKSCTTATNTVLHLYYYAATTTTLIIMMIIFTLSPIFLIQKRLTYTLMKRQWVIVRIQTYRIELCLIYWPRQKMQMVTHKNRGIQLFYTYLPTKCRWEMTKSYIKCGFLVHNPLPKSAFCD